MVSSSAVAAKPRNRQDDLAIAAYVERRVGSIIIPDTRDPISRARRSPEHCLYCTAPPDTEEHALADALGGRLKAPILCTAHNGLVNRSCDDPMFAQLAPLVNLLGIARTRGGRGVAFRGRTDAGDPVVVEADGSLRRKRLDAIEIAPGGILRFARGELAKVDELQRKGLVENKDLKVIAYIEREPAVNFEIRVAHDVERGVLKTALHFIAGFVADVDPAIASRLLPALVGTVLAGGEYVRTVPLDSRFFPVSWPPIHELRTFPCGEETFVTVLLFGLYGFQVRLPIATPTPVRYLQQLVSSDVHPILEENTHVRTFTWEDRLTKDNRDAFMANMRMRQDKIAGLAHYRNDVERCRQAYSKSLTGFARGNLDAIEAYRAELQIVGFSSDQIVRLIWWGRTAAQHGRLLWQIAIEDYTQSPLS